MIFMRQPGFFTRNKRWILPILVLVGGIVATSALVAMKKEPEKKDEKNSAVLVEVQTINLQPMTLAVKSRGVVRPKYETTLVAQVSGELTAINDAFVRGGVIKQGQLLAEIDPTDYEVRLEEAYATLASARAALDQEVAQSKVAKTEWENIYDTEAPALGLRKPQLEQARARVRASEAMVKQAKKNLSRTRIVAPYDALITARDVSLGTFANVGMRLGQIMDMSVAQIRLPVTNNDLQYLINAGVGARVELSGEANGQKHVWIGSIARTEGVIDNDTRMSYLVANVQDPYLLQTQSNAQVMPFGTYVVAEVQGIEILQSVEISRSFIKDGKVAVFHEGTLAFKAVEVLRNAEGISIVTEGLATGDQIILTALDFPVEGMEVEIQGANAEDASSHAAESEAD